MAATAVELQTPGDWSRAVVHRVKDGPIMMRQRKGHASHFLLRGTQTQGLARLVRGENQTQESLRQSQNGKLIRSNLTTLL